MAANVPSAPLLAYETESFCYFYFSGIFYHQANEIRLLSYDFFNGTQNLTGHFMHSKVSSRYIFQFTLLYYTITVWLFTLNGSFQARMAACQSPSYLNNDRSPSRSVLVPPPLTYRRQLSCPGAASGFTWALTLTQSLLAFPVCYQQGAL